MKVQIMGYIIFCACIVKDKTDFGGRNARETHLKNTKLLGFPHIRG